MANDAKPTDAGLAKIYDDAFIKASKSAMWISECMKAARRALYDAGKAEGDGTIATLEHGLQVAKATIAKPSVHSQRPRSRFGGFSREARRVMDDRELHEQALHDERQRGLAEKDAAISRSEALARKAESDLADRDGRLAMVARLLEDNGCDCPCDHSAEEHDSDCERCLACEIDACLKGWTAPKGEEESAMTDGDLEKLFESAALEARHDGSHSPLGQRMQHAGLRAVFAAGEAKSAATIARLERELEQAVEGKQADRELPKAVTSAELAEGRRLLLANAGAGWIANRQPYVAWLLRHAPQLLAAEERAQKAEAELAEARDDGRADMGGAVLKFLGESTPSRLRMTNVLAVTYAVNDVLASKVVEWGESTRLELDAAVTALADRDQRLQRFAEQSERACGIPWILDILAGWEPMNGGER